MVLTALRGALGFLTRLPVGADETAWEAFRRSPVTVPLAGYLIGALLVLPLSTPIPSPTTAIVFLAWLYLLTGISHVDGLADLGDALVVHGDAEDRLAVMGDTTVGVGAVLAVGWVLAGLALAGFALASAPFEIALLVISVEVGAKLGMAIQACVGTATHEGFGAAMTEPSGPQSVGLPILVAVPAGLLTWPHPAAAFALSVAVSAAMVVYVWARRRLGGVTGDVFGASNELARVAGLHAGVIAWMHW